MTNAVGNTVLTLLTAFQRELPKAPPRAALRAEAGFAEPSFQMSLGLDNPSRLIATKGMEIIDEMREDDALGAYMDIKKMAVTARQWRVRPASTDPQDVERADFLTHMFEMMGGALRSKLRELLSAMEYGYSVANMPLGLLESGPWRGKVVVTDLKVKEPHQYTFKTDRFRNIEQVVHVDPDGQTQYYEPREFVIYSHRAEFGNPYGKTDFQRAYRPWHYKRYDYRYWQKYLERHSGGVALIRYDVANPPKVNDTRYTEYKNFITHRTPRVGLMYPGTDEVAILEATGRGAESYSDAISKLNVFLARAVLIPDLLGFSESPGGAYALGQKHYDVHLQNGDGIAAELAEGAINDQVIRRVIDLNWAGVEAYPRFEFEPLEAEDTIALMTLALSAVQSGVLKPDLEIENLVRRAIGASEREEGSPGAGEKERPTNPTKKQVEKREEEPAKEGQGQGPAPGPAEKEGAVMANYQTARKRLDRIVGDLADYPRVVLVGGPRSGKSTVAVRAGERYGRRVRHADALIDQLEWSEASEEVSKWINAKGDWIIEGVVTARALRKWLAKNPGRMLEVALVWMNDAVQVRDVRREAMAKGVRTVWQEIEVDLREAGATIFDMTSAAEDGKAYEEPGEGGAGDDPILHLDV